MNIVLFSLLYILWLCCTFPVLWYVFHGTTRKNGSSKSNHIYVLFTLFLKYYNLWKKEVTNNISHSLISSTGIIPSHLSSFFNRLGMVGSLKSNSRWWFLLWRIIKLLDSCPHVFLLRSCPTQNKLHMEEIPHTSTTITIYMCCYIHIL